MNDLYVAVARIALEVHPERIDAICTALRSTSNANRIDVVKSALGDSFSPLLVRSLADALKVCPQVTSAELSAMFQGAAATATLAAGASSVELVWTGPETGLVPIRRTEQVLTGLIDSARQRLFLVCFVAYDIDSVVQALKKAAGRGVSTCILLEQSKDQGGNISIDSIGMMKTALPDATFFIWKQGMISQSGQYPGSVHAKCLVADGETAFITSANLTGAAMERNMELGVLVKGGPVPIQLEKHLESLVITKQITPV